MKRVREILALTALAAVFAAAPVLTQAAAIDPLAGWTGPVVIKYTNFDEGTVYNVGKIGRASCRVRVLI